MYTVLSIGTFIAVLWSIVGVPVGIVLIIVKLFNKKFLSWKKILLGCFGGFILFFILNVISGFIGMPIKTITLPPIK